MYKMYHGVLQGVLQLREAETCKGTDQILPRRHKMYHDSQPEDVSSQSPSGDVREGKG